MVKTLPEFIDPELFDAQQNQCLGTGRHIAEPNGPTGHAAFARVAAPGQHPKGAFHHRVGQMHENGIGAAPEDI